MNFLYLLLGIILLTAGGEALIRGALSSAQRLGVSPLLSGLVIVGFGTSAPELVVSVNAALHQQPDIAIGNVVGSNIANILLILGLCALIKPLTVTPLSLRRDASMVVFVSFLFVVLTMGHSLMHLHGVLLLSLLFVYLIWAYRSERNGAAPSAELHQAESEEISRIPQSALLTIVSIVVGLILLIGGSQVLLKGAIGIAQSLGVSEALIGLTLVAVGTSLPELSISLMAALRGHADVAVGNVLGSNIFNLLGILGVSSILQTLPIHERIVQFDQWVMLAAALLLFAFLFTGRKLSRLEGTVLCLGYITYLWFSF